MLVLVFAIFEGQVITVNDEALTAIANIVNDIRQIVQVILVHLDHAQSAGGIFIEQGFDDGRLAGAAAAPQQHMIAGLAGQKTFRVLHQFGFLGGDAEQIV